MKSGAVAVIDALGFKGIWGRPECKDDPSIVMRKMKDLLIRIRDERTTNATLSKFIFSIKATLLSDTIVIGAMVEARNPEQDGAYAERYAIELAATSVGRMMMHSTTAPPALAWRGCITYGQFDIEGQIVMGPAIDEAADLHQRSDAAVAWVTPGAKKIMDGEPIGSAALGALAPNIRVPLHGSNSYVTYVVQPGFLEEDWDKRKSWRNTVLSTFDRQSLEVQIKKQNTEAVLQELDRHHEKWVKEINNHNNRIG